MKENDKISIFDLASPLDFRYYVSDSAVFERLKNHASEEAYVQTQLKVELELLWALEELGLVPKGTYAKAGKAQITAQKVYEEEKKTEHNVRALVNLIQKSLPPEATPYVHLFATSMDITDTAQALRIKKMVEEVILPDFIALTELIVQMAKKESKTAQIGRTHGQFAEPVTFGFHLAYYASRLLGRIEKIQEANNKLIGKFAGPVGAYNALALAFGDKAPLFEKLILNRLGLEVDERHVSTQIVQPEPLADLGYAILSAFSVLANLADDMRHLYRSEIAEVFERGAEKRVGSSTMPHKINPKDFENVKSLWKAYAPRIMTLLSDQISEHQRDLTNSASNRFAVELFVAFEQAVLRMNKALSRLEPNRENLKKNLEASKSLIVAEPIYIALALAGHPAPYDKAKELANRVRNKRENPVAIVKKELPEYWNKISDQAKKVLDDPAAYTGAASARAVEITAAAVKRLAQLKAELKKPIPRMDFSADIEELKGELKKRK
ncbi:MAG TPA: lyase family protein [candidate division Zixibacteria bacterium]|nr:lyase family protein [candidate division Zixibacteria bacterium]